PINQLGLQGSNTTVGIYASASRQQVHILRKDGSADDNGPFVQVSRLGEPLINEAVIPLGKKDFWNRADPADDAQFETFYLNPRSRRLGTILEGTPPQGHTGGALAAIDTTGRTDLVAILLTGVPGLNFTGNTRADLLRLNTKIAPSAAVGAGNPLGVLAG